MQRALRPSPLPRDRSGGSRARRRGLAQLALLGRSTVLRVDAAALGTGRGPVVRRATPDDAVACQAIYAPYVRDTVISLETDPPSVPEIRDRMERSLETHDWLVLEDDEGIRGYAYGSS